MNRRNLLGLSVIAMTAMGLGPLSDNALAQQKSLKEQLVGTWTLVSQENTAANGTKLQVASPKGILIFDAGGRYAEVAGRGDRPKFKNAAQPTTEELAAATQNYFAANFGTWSVSEADKTITQRFEAALRPNNEGLDIKSSASLAGDELKLSTTIPSSGAKVDAVYRRAK